MNSAASRAVPSAPRWVVGVALAAGVVALAGGYWDDAWHTEHGRDQFFIPPHIAIYAGVAVTGAALALWAGLAVRAGDNVREALAHRPLALALLAVAVTLASGPIDNAWHEAFGKDAVIWSPPHMLGIAGTLALGAAILAEVAQDRERFAPAVAAAAGAFVIASAAFTVVEYDTDVPQFDTLWYLPVLAFAAAIAFSIVKLASDRPYAATEAAAVQLAFVAAVALFLLAVDFPTPGVPLLIPAALALDIAATRRLPLPVQAGAFALALYAVYVPVRNWVGEGVEFTWEDVVVGLPLAWAASWVVLAVASRGIPGLRRRKITVALVLSLTVALASATSALAHDPGQGKDAGELALSVTGRDQTITLIGQATAENCRGLQPRALAARRGGHTLRAPLALSDCRFEGRIQVPQRGRWFVYAEFRRGGRDIESWLPVVVGERLHKVSDPARYAYEPDNSSAGPAQVVAGVVLYTGMAALVIATFALVRRPTAAASP